MSITAETAGYQGILRKMVKRQLEAVRVDGLGKSNWKLRKHLK